MSYKICQSCQIETDIAGNHKCIYGQCARCGEYYPVEQMSEPDDISYYALCENCHEIEKENKEVQAAN